MVVVLRVPGLSGSYSKLGLTVMERKIVVVVEYYSSFGVVCW